MKFKRLRAYIWPEKPTLVSVVGKPLPYWDTRTNEVVVDQLAVLKNQVLTQQLQSLQSRRYRDVPPIFGAVSDTPPTTRQGGLENLGGAWKRRTGNCCSDNQVLTTGLLSSTLNSAKSIPTFVAFTPLGGMASYDETVDTVSRTYGAASSLSAQVLSSPGLRR